MLVNDTANDMVNTTFGYDSCQLQINVNVLASQRA